MSKGTPQERTGARCGAPVYFKINGEGISILKRQGVSDASQTHFKQRSWGIIN